MPTYQAHIAIDDTVQRRLAGLRRRLCYTLLVSARIFVPFILPALLALPLGFVGLAWAAENEPTIPTAVLLFSPGLKVAELLTPEKRQALGVAFGWFLRVGIVVNAAYYFTLFLLLVYFLKRVKRRRSPVT